ncbi:MAG: thioesterase family protein [Pseudomonadota bacterium]
MDHGISLLLPLRIAPSWQGVVRPDQADHLGHMNVQHYVAAVSAGVFALLQEAGLDRHDASRNAVHVAGAHMEIDFFRECWPGETLQLLSAVTQVKTSSVLFLHELVAGPEQSLAMRCTVRGVCIGVKERRACPLPEALRLRLAHMAVRLPPPDADLELPRR